MQNERPIPPTAIQQGKKSNLPKSHSSSSTIAISRSFGCAFSYPLLDRESRGVNHTYDTKDAKKDIENACRAGLRDCSVVKHRLKLVSVLCIKEELL
jgi:hypothetical protein